MPKESVFTLKLETELRDAFMSEAEAAHRPASQIVRDFMRDFVTKKQEARDYEVWLAEDIARGLKEADDPKTKWYTHDEVLANMERQRQSLLERIRARDAAENEEAARINAASNAAE